MGSGLLRRAEELRALDERLHAAQGAPEHTAIAEQFRALLLETLAPYDGGDVEDGIEFLEVRPRFFRSGYTAEKLMRRLSNADLTSGQARRYRAAVTAIRDEHPSREQRLATSILARLS